MSVPIKQVGKRLSGIAEQGNYNYPIMVYSGRFSTKPEFLQSPDTRTLRPENKLIMQIGKGNIKKSVKVT